MPLVWLHLALFAVTILAFILPGDDDFRLRLLGTGLQLIGVLTVWWDLSSAAREFHVPGAWRNTWAWLKEGFTGIQPVTGLMGAVSMGLTGKARAKSRWPMDESLSTEVRLQNIQKTVDAIDLDLDQAFREMGTQGARQAETIRNEAAERRAGIAALEAQMKRTAVGNLSLLVTGAIWLGIGIVVATLAPEIHKHLGG